LAAAQAAIEDRIEALEPRARKLMRHRYIEGLSWEEVCVAMCYSWRQTHNIHGAALDALLAAEVVHGDWYGVGNMWMCTVCEEQFYTMAPYCPNCGAKMDGDEVEA
ncbi:MAG: sigma-70 family RNA polymerase sigma factor, partial [Oscillospiraceae bacterium]|nr:sigma-70 family RNA polymerase sigma factor [Oscillospiraceae bacterium]